MKQITKMLKDKWLNLKKSYYESKMKPVFDKKLSLKIDKTIKEREE